MDVVMMSKILLIKRYYNLSDERSLAQNLIELKALLD
ncbi:MAG: hypothetical protein LBS50_02510 [Prevotellaceae bacterium]|nr:hypothetical protein [Prevotellaceae bacterium]